jgi:hypothetical protein
MKILLMFNKKMLIKTGIKTKSINIYKLTIMKSSLRAVCCVSKVNMAKSDKKNYKERGRWNMGIIDRKFPLMAEFIMWIVVMTN